MPDETPRLVTFQAAPDPAKWFALAIWAAIAVQAIVAGVIALIAGQPATITLPALPASPPTIFVVPVSPEAYGAYKLAQQKADAPAIKQ